jgi:membrane protein required for colicin V production
MNLVDILIWLILAGFVYLGFTRGLVRQICSLSGFLLGGWAAIRYHLYLADASRHLIHLPHYLATILSFLFIFLLTGLLFFLLGHVLTVMLKVVMLGGLNRIGGVIFGFLEGAFIVAMVLFISTSRPVPEKFKGYIHHSATAGPFLEAGKEIVAGWGGLPDLMKPAAGGGVKKSAAPARE